jgi:hypothetical protein
MRSRQSRNTMPNYPTKVDILYLHTVDVKLVFVRKAADEFGYAALSAVPFINEWRDDGNAAAGHGSWR